MFFKEIVDKYSFDDIKHFIENDKEKAKKLLDLLKETEKDKIFSSMILTVEPTIGMLVISEEDIIYHVSVLPLDLCLNCHVNKKDLDFYGEKEILSMFIDDSIKNNEKILSKIKTLENDLYQNEIVFTPDEDLEIDEEEYSTEEVAGLNFRALKYLDEYFSHEKNYMNFTFRIYEDGGLELVNFKNINKKIKYKKPYKYVETSSGEKIILSEYVFDDNSIIREDIQATRFDVFLVYFLALKDDNNKWITETLWKEEEMENYF